MSDQLLTGLRNALAGMREGPNPLFRAISFYTPAGAAAVKEGDFVKRIGSSPDDAVRRRLHDQFAQWDYEVDPAWADGTAANTAARRIRIYQLLVVGKEIAKLMDEVMPVYEAGNALIEDSKDRVKWYTAEFRSGHDFYGSRFIDFLRDRRKFLPNALGSLDAATNEVLGRLGDPAASAGYAARGLVVGYVQSGKTTNFTGVIAKAIDAGYRLIVVLSGTTDLLRNQTQRRLDMTLVGRENILGGVDENDIDHEYKPDDDWPKEFISYGRQPGALGGADITRLTGQSDYTRRLDGLKQLDFDFEKLDRRQPLFIRENLEHAGARLVIIKKVDGRLGQFVKSLEAVGKKRCAELPALIIDDESDQASINTVNPNKKPKGDDKGEDKKRTSINGRIVEILRLLPRAQYLGYTATPFANVFVNPMDTKDIYPRDFILSLERPEDYMGARAFVDFDPIPSGKMGNKEALIRPVPEKGTQVTDSNDRLMEAIDAFVLTGAIKKYRAKKSGVTFKHHTMLVNESSSTARHSSMEERIEKLWKQAGYFSTGKAYPRLERLLADFRGVWQDRGKEAGLPFPRDLTELKLYLGQALAEITREGSAVKKVNSAEGGEAPDFDGKRGIWRIIVGGSKLARGYTIEGLTISYFRRATKMQDTLMQMGRWFGFRPGYSDLVRLYIGSAEPDGKDKTIDLYDAFSEMVKDEEAFRAQLEQYAGDSSVTPMDIPALVYNSHPRLRPTARSKMYYTELAWASFTYREPTTQAFSPKGRNHNADLVTHLIENADLKQSSARLKDGDTSNIKFMWIKAGKTEIRDILKGFKWSDEGSSIGAEIEFLDRPECTAKSWLIIMPQVGERSKGGEWNVAGKTVSCVSRSRIGDRFRVFSTPADVRFAKWLIEGGNRISCSDLKPSDERGVLLLYPTREKIGDRVVGGTPVMGFGLMVPTSTAKMKVAFRPRTQ